ncbi:MAG: type II secretion system F family protein [Verrucomicrobia bacterium]|nr:type II secretion system F family protein [Verrucomicrobiota bacterium]
MKFASKDLAVFYTQLGTMIQAGVPIQNAMKHAAPRPMRSVAAQLNDMVQRGEPLHAAIASQPKKFRSLDHQALFISERSGALDVGLFSLANYYGKRASAKSKIISASFFPALLLVGAVFISRIPAYILGAVGQGDYSALSFFRDTAGVLALLGGGVAGGCWVVRWLFTVPRLNLALDYAVRIIPVVGRFRFDYALSQWLQAIRLMLRAGQGIIEAMDYSTKMTTSPLIARGYALARPHLNSQLNVSQALEATGVFPPMLIQLWATGEQSGRMDEMLDRLVQAYEDQWQRSLAALASWLPRMVYGLVSLYIVSQIFQFAKGYVNTLDQIMK